MTDAFIASARRSIRRSMFQRFKTLGLTQDQLVRAVAVASDKALIETHVAELAAVVASAGTVANALAASTPDDPSLITFRSVIDGSGGGISALVAYVEP